MSVKLVMFVQCDVCGNELDGQYPPEVLRHDYAFGVVDLDNLRSQVDGQVKAKGWAKTPGARLRMDRWGNPIRYRCHECRAERRWE